MIHEADGCSSNIYQVGLMGAGKTTVGRQLAKRLHRRFVDSDHEIETRTGVRIPLIFDIEGEAGFRRRESQVLAELVQEPGLVMATGGGAVLATENRRCLRDNGIVVYLCAPPEVLYQRTRHDRNRPVLEVPVYGQKNNDRYPTYHRLDASATVKLNKDTEKKYQHSLTFSVFNVYGRKNSVFINFNKTEVSERDFKVPSNVLVSDRAISQFYLFQFTPAISYNFKWK